MTTISFPSGAVCMEQNNSNNYGYTITAHCSAATVSGESLSLKEFRGQLVSVPGSGGDKCEGQIELTLRDESNGVDVKYDVQLAENFFMRLITSNGGYIKSGAVEINRFSKEGGYFGRPRVFTMDMTINLSNLSFADAEDM